MAQALKGFSPKQQRVLRWWQPGSPDRERDVIICDGAVRSGKTMCLALSFFLWSMACFEGECFALCGKTIEGVKRNLLVQVLPILEQMGMECTLREADGATWKTGEHFLPVWRKGRGLPRPDPGHYPGGGAAGRGGPDAREFCGTGLRPMLGDWQPHLDDLQP